MSVLRSRSYTDYFRYIMAVFLAMAAIYLVATTYRWPLLWDGQVLHYINFLMHHGYAPYRDITDMNMPGAYLIDGWSIDIFGSSDLGWRIYDFTLLGIMIGATVLIALPYDWLAGLFAGVFFALMHAADGPINTGQRDELMTVLIMVGYAFLFEAVRRRRPWMMAISGLSLGMACSVKPTVAPLAIGLLLMAWFVLRKQGEPIASYLWSGVAGAAAATSIVLGFLLQYHSVGAFLEINRKLTPYYVGLENKSVSSLLANAIPNAIVLLSPFAIAAFVVNRRWKNWEHWALLVGALFGGFTYLIQRKGYQYHKYMLMAFLLLWIAIELTITMRKQGWVRAIGFAGMALGTFYLVPRYANRAQMNDGTSHYTESLEKDLTRLGPDQLQRKIQCLDLVEGCLNVLYHLKIVQSTGSTGDLLLFSPDHRPVQRFYQDLFMQQLNQNPPSVIVLSNEWFTWGTTFDKVNQWPEFAEYMQKNFDLRVERHFERENNSAYRIYQRKGTDLPLLVGETRYPSIRAALLPAP